MNAVGYFYDSSLISENVQYYTAKRRKTTANESVNCDYIFFANISSCHAGLLQGCYITALKKSCMAGRNIGKKYIIAVNRLIRCCFSSFCGVSTYKFNRYPSSQASADPTSDVHIVAFPFSIYFVQYYPATKKLTSKKLQHVRWNHIYPDIRSLSA